MLNVRDVPNPYTPGGLQIQIWNNSDTPLASSTSTLATAELSNSNEEITWTQRIVMKDTTIFEVVDGHSTTWGTFGSAPGQGLAAITLSGTTSLSTYDPQVSVTLSRVGWMANNVTSMTLLRVRQYDSTGNKLTPDDEPDLNLMVKLTPD